MADDDFKSTTPSLKLTLDDTIAALERGRAHHSQQAQEYGAAKDLFYGFRGLADKVPEQYLQPFIPGFNKFKVFAEAQELARRTSSVSSSAMSMVGTATAVCGVPTHPEVAAFIKTHLRAPSFWTSARSELYGAKLATLDAELGRVYRGISEAFWSLKENPERAAMFSARQCFDHLFEVLAPDDAAIRKSPFFQRKPDSKDQEAVSRVERVKFAASTRVRDKAQVDFLVEQASELVAQYRELQKLHAREALDRDRARAVLQTFMASIEQWVDALRL